MLYRCNTAYKTFIYMYWCRWCRWLWHAYFLLLYSFKKQMCHERFLKGFWSKLKICLSFELDSFSNFICSYSVQYYFFLKLLNNPFITLKKMLFVLYGCCSMLIVQNLTVPSTTFCVVILPVCKISKSMLCFIVLC